ncbi:UNVERIFIED_CONTAM: hypothetical protein Slati_1418900 [Sesamum latifolium]|uniref:Endonuclease/exonuclease/phosphatase domain-containing protein n=1 Tax=Sesamum latifolium TaxID=2727402 RepID=A0AAW2X5B7_9LAMI
MELIKLHSSGLVFLSECKSRRYNRLKEKFNYNSVGPVGKSGGLLLLWRKDIEAWLQSYLVNHVDAMTKYDDCPERWRFTGFYSQSDSNRRKEMWNFLRRLWHESIRPWLCAGEYNEILEQHEKQRILPRAHWQINDFHEYLRDGDLHDLGFEGEIFRWNNRVETPHTVRARLDRVCSDTQWANLFHSTKVHREMVTYFDHAAIWISLFEEPVHTADCRKCQFRFEAAWVAYLECTEVIHRTWSSAKVFDYHVTVGNQTRASRLGLLQWNRDRFTNIRRQTQ